MSKKCEVKFISTSAEAKKTMAGLSKTALRESGKLIRKILRKNVPLRSKRFKNHIASWAFIDKQTGQPTLQIGFYSRQRVIAKGKQPSRANPHWIEFGTGPHEIKPRRAKAMAYNENFFGKKVNHPGQRGTHVLRDSVQNNIKQIRAVQSQYLKELNETLEAAGAKIHEGEEDESD